MENKPINFNNYIKIIVTGVLYKSNKRFKAKVYDNDIVGRLTAFSINLWRGSIWGLDSKGRRKLIKRVYN